MPSGKGLASEVEAWLETLAVDASQTLRQEPRSTIIPTRVRSTGGRKAMAMLEQLAGLSPGSSAQLKTGATIGEGGMGIIRLAEQTALGRTVAVKTLKGDKKDATAALDLLREAWVTGALEHPNIVPVHHVGLDDDGSPIIVLKRIEGVSWHDILEDAEKVHAQFGAHDLLAWNLGILLQVLNAVRFAHSRGIIHRDLKPANVMVGEFGEVYLLDWGVEDLGQLGARDGTPAASGATGARILSVSMTVASDASTRDVVFVQLKGGKGAFAGRDPAPGTYALAGAELDYNTCGVCVTVIGDLVAGQGPTQFYFQRAGTVTITQTAGSLVGSLAGMEFLELDLATEELVRDGCTTQVGGLSFDEVLP